MAVAVCAMLTGGVALGQNTPAPVVGPRGTIPDTPPGGETSSTTTENEQPVTRRATLRGPVYTILQFTISYARPNPGLPSIESIEAKKFPLGFVEGRWTSPALALDYGGTVEMVSISQLNLGDALAVGDYDGTRAYHFTAVDAILDEVRAVVNDAGYIGIRTIPDPNDITIQGEDLRSAMDQPVGILILSAEVTATRTVASGERVPTSDRIDNPMHTGIPADSPIQPTEMDAEVANPQALLTKEKLDRYLFQLNRHPGRRVDVAVSALDEPGAVQLDYLVNENKPWVLYYQVTNTGTETTEELRHRFGFVHNQLTSNDDILSLDAIVSSFGDPDSEAYLATYEAPLFSPRLRGRAHAYFTQFDASEIGQANEDFEGETYGADGRLAWNFYQQQNFFLDALAGIDYRHIMVRNNVTRQQGRTQFIIPYIGLGTEMITDTNRLVGDVRVMWNPNLVNEDFAELQDLGRVKPDEDWVLLRANASYSFYLEPLLFPNSWEDPSTPRTSTLAHEVLLRATGQFTESRLVPQFEGILGGLYTVRGYPEALTAGDNTLFVSAEYRFHIPRMFPVDRTPDMELFGEPFRVAPQEVYAQPDWDLVLKSFVDYGMVRLNDKTTGEQDDDLLSAGVGVGFLFKKNLSIDVDLGFAINDAQQGLANEVEPGDTELHFSLTVLY
ncbi:MAG: ShlB/FhaC/HecB family hemolysin secretion/activation protein [Phycisphaeraceae bacterium]